MKPCAWFLGEDATESFIRLTRRQKLVVLDLLRHLAQFPHLDPDRFVRTGRRDLIREKTFGRWQLAWWVDEPVNEIHILSIRKLGR